MMLRAAELDADASCSMRSVPIRSISVSARTHEIARLESFRAEGCLRSNYDDVEDFLQIHVKFSDGTVADIFSTEIALGTYITGSRLFATITARVAI
jgi:hypothetical protein